MSTLQQPFATYNGGKSGNGTFQTIINNIPKCEIFIDAMVGNGGIVCNLSLPGITVINDINAGIIDSYNLNGQGNIVKEKMHVLDLIDKYDCKGSRTFIYFDPPYLKSSRKNQQDLYEFEWSTTDHEKFLKRAVTVQSNCMISHYPCSLYNEALSGWRKVEFLSMTRAGLATECIYMNYPAPTVLQDYRYLGSNSIDRQRIKRKVNRFISKLQALPIHERTSIINAIKSNFYD